MHRFKNLVEWEGAIQRDCNTARLLVKGDGSETVMAWWIKESGLDASSHPRGKWTHSLFFHFHSAFFLLFPLSLADGRGKKLRTNDGRRALSTRIFRISCTEARYFRCRAQYFRRLSANPLMEPSAGLHRSLYPHSFVFSLPLVTRFTLLPAMRSE